MNPEDMLQRLTRFGRRLTTIADQIHEVREQAQHALDRVYLLCDDLEQLRRELVAETEAHRLQITHRRQA